MWPVYAIVLSLLQVIRGSRGNVLLGQWNTTVIECSSNTELTFTFNSSRSTKSIAIAECDMFKKSCQLTDSALRNKYNISYTSRGGILYVISLDNDTYGKYTCSETDNPDIFASTNITPFNVADTTKPASVECSSKAEITFRYSRRNTNTSRSLAECDHTLRACRMLETYAQNKYTISYTGRGGILRVNNLEDETIGTYTCCETYYSTSCFSADVIGYYTDELRNSSDGVYYVDNNTTATSSRGYNTDNQTNALAIVLPICVVLLAVLIAICVVKKRNRRRKGHDSNRQSLSKKKKKQTMDSDEEFEADDATVATEVIGNRGNMKVGFSKLMMEDEGATKSLKPDLLSVMASNKPVGKCFKHDPNWRGKVQWLLNSLRDALVPDKYLARFFRLLCTCEEHGAREIVNPWESVTDEHLANAVNFLDNHVSQQPQDPASQAIRKMLADLRKAGEINEQTTYRDCPQLVRQLSALRLLYLLRQCVEHDYGILESTRMSVQQPRVPVRVEQTKTFELQGISEEMIGRVIGSKGSNIMPLQRRHACKIVIEYKIDGERGIVNAVITKKVKNVDSLKYIYEELQTLADNAKSSLERF